MHKRFIPFAEVGLLAMMAFAAQVRDSRTASEGGITRRLMVDEPSVQAVRSTYRPGATELRGPHRFDVVLVPLSEGKMEVSVAGKSLEWKIGEAIFIGRGVEHDIANNGKTPVEFVSIRIP